MSTKKHGLRLVARDSEDSVSKSNQERGALFKQRQSESCGTSLLLNLNGLDSVRLELLASLTRSSKSETLRQSLRAYFEDHKSDLEEFKKEYDVKYRRITARLK